MRLKYLLPIAASLAALLPLSASAGEWPAGAKQEYMTQCQAAAKQQVDAATAEKHCSCGANVIEKKFTTAEIKQLSDTTTAPSAALRNKLMTEVLACKNS